MPCVILTLVYTCWLHVEIIVRHFECCMCCTILHSMHEWLKSPYGSPSSKGLCLWKQLCISPYFLYFARKHIHTPTIYNEPKINNVYDMHTFLGGFKCMILVQSVGSGHMAMPILHSSQKVHDDMWMICSTCKRFSLRLVWRIKTCKPSTQCTIIKLNSKGFDPYPPLSFILSIS